MESPTKRLKKSTAKFVRSELEKTQQRSHGMLLRLVCVVVLALAFSFGYVAFVA